MKYFDFKYEGHLSPSEAKLLAPIDWQHQLSSFLMT